MASSAGRAAVGRFHDGGLYVSEFQRARLLEATFALVAEQGVRGMTVRGVAARAGVSPKTFYELFADGEDCFLAAFDHAVARLAGEARPAYDAQSEWVAKVRAALASLLVSLDREPALRCLVFVEALSAGPRVLARRARVLESLAAVVDQGRANAKAPAGLPALTAEGVLGATFAVIYARLSEQRSEPLIDLLGSLTAAIVLPYRGSRAAARELARPVPSATVGGPGDSRASAGRPLGSTAPVDFRLTIRTRMALAAVAELGGGGSGPNNREVSEHMNISDQGQVSRLMMRVADQGLVENARGSGEGHGKGLAKAWRLTPHGQSTIDAHGGGRVPVNAWPAVSEPAFRMTARTHLVLTAVAELSARGPERSGDPSNAEIGAAAGVKDPGQLSRLLRRLEHHGLLRSSAAATAGAPNSWRLTARGEELLHASRGADGGPHVKPNPTSQITR